MGAFTFGGKTIVAPGILVSSEIGVQTALQLLPFGTVAMLGISEGGKGGGTIYSFNDTATMQRVLRSGPLYDALTYAAVAGASAGLIAVVAGTKTGSTLALVGAAGASATLSSGDQGHWTEEIRVSAAPGTIAGSLVFTFSYPDPLSGATVYVGGLGSAFDNIVLFSQLRTAITKNAVLTPPTSTGLPPIVTLAVVTDGLPTALPMTQLLGGTTPAALDFEDVTTAVDAMIDIGFDIGHLVQVYDEASQAYADAQAVSVSPYGRGRRFFHQTQVYASWSATLEDETIAGATTFTFDITQGTPKTGDLFVLDTGGNQETLTVARYTVGGEFATITTTAGAIYPHAVSAAAEYSGAASTDKAVNSEAVANTLVGVAAAIDSIRSSVIAQQGQYVDPNTSVTNLVDIAPFLCGLASNVGANGANGPATPLTMSTIPGLIGLDYPVLKTTGDQDRAISGGGIVCETVGTGAATIVRIVQSVTTAPVDANGDAWIFAEFSVVRVSDALLANCVAALEENKPKVVGGGNTNAVMSSALADVTDVLEDALEATWITGYDSRSLGIFATGTTGEDDILQYSAAPTLPLNHLGIAQTLLPFQAVLSVTG